MFATSSRIRSIGQNCKPPLVEGNAQNNRRRNTFSTNVHGDVALLTQDGGIKVSNLRSSSDVLQDLPVDDMATIRSHRFTNVEYNADGSLLLLWSDDAAGIIDIPRKLAPEGPLNVAMHGDCQCKYIPIGQEYLTESGALIHASFHNLSAMHVVLLVKGALLLIDIGSETMDTRFFPVGVDRKFTSFCFGPNLDWMKFGVFLLSDRKGRTEVYALCPIIPNGAIVPRVAVADLWAWVDEQEEFTDVAYIKMVRDYVTAAFGPRGEMEPRDNELMMSGGAGTTRPYEYTLSNAPYQHTLNTPYQYTLSIHLTYPTIHSLIHPINTPSKTPYQPPCDRHDQSRLNLLHHILTITPYHHHPSNTPSNTLYQHPLSTPL